MKYSFETSFSCNGCVNAVRIDLDEHKFIESWEVTLGSPAILEVNMKEDGTPEMVIEVVKELGYDIKLKV